MKKINAFGKKVSREDAYKIIINDYIGDIVYAQNTSVLEFLLIEGWPSLKEWSDKELEEFISELLIENQPTQND